MSALREIDLFMPNEREAQLMTGKSDPGEMLRALADAGLKGVALKLGESGSALLWNRDIYRCGPHDATPVDTTGAGDSFDAGFIHGLLQDESPMACLRIGNICGALSTEALGGIAAFPNRDQLAAAMRR